MKKMILTIAAALSISVLGLATSSSAAMYSGTLTNLSGLTATEQWGGILGAELTWNVDDFSAGNGLWTYVYSFAVADKDISHIILEVSETFTEKNIKDGTTPGFQGPILYTNDDGKSNPGMPDGGVFGIKWDLDPSDLKFDLTIVTDRAPMWGDFYAKDGKTGGNDVYAFNTMFGIDTDAIIGDGNAGGWALVPDTNGGGGGGDPVPEPGTFILLGAGLAGLALYRRKQKK